MNSINVGITELKKLMEWLETIEPKPYNVTIITESTGIGTAVRAEIRTAEDEGRWKDLTDYDNW